MKCNPSTPLIAPSAATLPIDLSFAVVSGHPDGDGFTLSLPVPGTLSTRIYRGWFRTKEAAELVICAAMHPGAIKAA